MSGSDNECLTQTDDVAIVMVGMGLVLCGFGRCLAVDVRASVASAIASLISFSQ